MDTAFDFFDFSCVLLDFIIIIFRNSVLLLDLELARFCFLVATVLRYCVFISFVPFCYCSDARPRICDNMASLAEEGSLVVISLVNSPKSFRIIDKGTTTMGLPIFDLSEVGVPRRSLKLSIVAVEALVVWFVVLKLGQILLPSQEAWSDIKLTDLLCKVSPDQFGGLADDLLSSSFQPFDLFCQLFGGRQCFKLCGLDGVYSFFDWV